MKILILRFSSIGDIVLTTPVMRNLKKQIPGAEVHYCTKRRFEEIVSYNPYIDKVFLLDQSLNSLIKDLKQEKYDLVIDLHNNLRTRLIKWRLGVKTRTFNKINYKKWLIVNFKIDNLPKVHIVDRYMDTLAVLDIKNDQHGLDYFIPTKDEVQMNNLPEAFRNGYAVYVIGAQHNTKKLPLHKMVELVSLISQPVIILGGKDDNSIAEEICIQLKSQRAENAMIPKKHVFNACGKYNLNQSASIVKSSDIVYSHDTGLMHIAAAFKKEIYSIWGNTIPEFGMYPYKTSFKVWEVEGLSCRPCSKIGYKKCPQKHFKCMNDMRFLFNYPM